MKERFLNMAGLAMLIFIMTFTINTNSLFAQGHHHGGGQHNNMWPDSLETVTLTGWALIDSTHVMPMYYLDTDNDGLADYQLSFGPYWYQSSSGAVRPNQGDEINIVGARWGEDDELTIIIVYEINGLGWREPIEGGMNGWDGDHFWGDEQNQITATGTLLIDSSYFYVHYFLDEDNDGAPEYRLNFGPPWYIIDNTDLLPQPGEQVTVTGIEHGEGMMATSSIMVYEINGITWREPTGPPPWSGNWIHRDDDDTSYVHAPTDSLDWMSHPPGSMSGMMMGGGSFPDSVYCQFEEMYPDFMPGEHDSTMFAGYYMNIYAPDGQTMMSGGGMMGGHGGMRFNRAITFNFHYDDEQLLQMNLSDEEIKVRYWDDENSTWITVTNYSIDQDNNVISFQSNDMNSYYALFGTKLTTNIEQENVIAAAPENFTLYQNYPNPFNPETLITFHLPHQSQTSLIVYNVLGQKIKTLISTTIEAGYHQVKWDGSDDFSAPVPSGFYFVQLKSENRSEMIKMTLLK